MMRRVLVLAAAAMLVVTGCSNPRSGSLGAAPTLAPSGQPTGADSAAPGGTFTPPSVADPGRPGTITIQVWFTRDGRLSPTRRTRPATLATSRLALTELTRGPTAHEGRAPPAPGPPPAAGAHRIARRPHGHRGTRRPRHRTARRAGLHDRRHRGRRGGR